MSRLDKWDTYLTVQARAMLEALKISERYNEDAGQTFADAALEAQRLADETQCAMVVGWQINDGSGNKEPGYAPLTALSLMTLEPVALVYPLERELTCKPKR